MIFPEPEHTVGNPWPDGFDVPGPARTLLARAKSLGWTGDVRYSRGCLPHASTGQPGALAHFVGVRLRHSDGARAYAVMKRAVAGSTWAWGSIGVSAVGYWPIVGLQMHELDDFLNRDGKIDQAWIDRHAWNVQVRIAKAKKKAEEGKKAGKRKVTS